MSEAIEFVCRCGWEGTEPVLDAHVNPWCPECGRPADFKAAVEESG